METILGWSLIIAAAAIILMLALLLASERELKRRRTEIELLRSRFKRTGADAVMDFEIEFGAGTNREPTAESAALRQQLQSSQADVENMWNELERLRAENARLTRQNPRQQNETGEELAPVVAGAVMTQAAANNTRTAPGRRQFAPPNRRVVFAACVGALLLVASGSVYLARPWRSAAPAPAPHAVPAVTSPPKQITSAEDTIRAVDPGATSAENSPVKKTVTKKNTAPGANYEVVRSTRVFSQPNESSQPLSRVEAGMEINVVGARDGWLEVRSRHGRPPGFIKKDAAIVKELSQRGAGR